MENKMEFPQKMKNRAIYDPVIPLLSISKELKTRYQ